MKCFTIEVNKDPFTRNDKKNQRNNRKIPCLGPLWAKPARIPTFFSILMCFDQVYIISEEETIHRVSTGMTESP